MMIKIGDKVRVDYAVALTTQQKRNLCDYISDTFGFDTHVDDLLMDFDVDRIIQIITNVVGVVVDSDDDDFEVDFMSISDLRNPHLLSVDLDERDILRSLWFHPFELYKCDTDTKCVDVWDKLRRILDSITNN